MNEFIHGTVGLASDPGLLGIFFAALILGLFFGAIPGLSGMTLASVALPFTLYFPMEQAILFYAVVYVSAVYGGAVTAILFNIPGSIENAPTAIEGYPMTMRGQSGKAIGLSITSSALGGVAASVFLMASIGFVSRWAVQTIGPVEKSAMMFFALCLVSKFGDGTGSRRWISMFLGLFLAVIGTDPVGGLPRYAFGSYYIMSGISFAALLLGFFAISEVFVQGEKIVSGVHRTPPIAIEFPRRRELWKFKGNIARSALIGFLCGVLPGVGSALGSFISYTESFRWTRNGIGPGNGNPDGVVASETANNAATAGAMIPLLGLGLPGGGYTAIMISVFVLHGLTPGPLVMIQQKDLVWLLFCGMFWASVLIFFLGLIETRIIVHLLRIPFSIFGPVVLVLATIGAYSLNNSILDVWTLFIAGIVGYFLRRLGYSLIIVVMSFILGRLGETFLYQTMILTDYDLTRVFHSPIAVLFIVSSMLILAGRRRRRVT